MALLVKNDFMVNGRYLTNYPPFEPLDFTVTE
jgi:hypothetical protein